MSRPQTIAPTAVAATSPARYAYTDNLKVLLVVGVIVAHVTAAWTGNEDWVLNEPPVRDPLLTLLKLASLVGVRFAMPLFFLIAGGRDGPSSGALGDRRTEHVRAT
jgi:glucan biosynthesis protein C